jgi:hypothetical protein
MACMTRAVAAPQAVTAAAIAAHAYMAASCDNIPTARLVVLLVFLVAFLLLALYNAALAAGAELGGKCASYMIGLVLYLAYLVVTVAINKSESGDKLVFLALLLLGLALFQHLLFKLCKMCPDTCTPPAPPSDEEAPEPPTATQTTVLS